MNKISIKDEYAKNDELTESSVEIIKEWMRQQQHLPKITDLQVILFLHSCYYSIERAKIYIEKYYSIRTHVPEVFKNRNPTLLRSQLRLSLVTTLISHQPTTILFLKITNSDTTDFHFNSYIKIMDMVTSLHYYQHGTSERELVVVDCNGITLGHLLKVNLPVLKKAFIYLQEAIPIRLKGVHFINVNSAGRKIVAMAKPFIKSELLNMIYFHDSLDYLFKYIPQKYLPNEYGGEAGSIEEIWEKQIQELEANSKYFEEDELLTSDESKRLNKSEYTADQIFGMDGTFRKLDID